MKIDYISLKNGSASFFRLNVDACDDLVVRNVEIGARDSLYIFVRVELNPNNQTNPLLIEDEIQFGFNGKTQSVLLQAYYDIEYLFTVPPSVFNPPPKVQSAVISLKRNSRESLPCDEKLFKTVVKTTFNQRRKTIRNSIKPLIPDGDFSKKEDIDLLTKRPEQLSVEEFIRLTEWLAQ